MLVAYRPNNCDQTCSLQHQYEAKKARKARLPEAEREGLNASSVLGKTRRAPKTADGAAEKQSVCQKRDKI